MPYYKVFLTNYDMLKLGKLKLADKGDLRKASNEVFLTHLIRTDLLKDVLLEETFQTAIRKATSEALATIWATNFGMLLAKGYIFNVEDWLEEMNRQLEAKGEEWFIENRDQPTIPVDIQELVGISQIPKRPEKPLIIVAAGPSVREHKHVELLGKSEWNGTILATDRMLRPLIEAGVSPSSGYDLMVASVDGNRIHIPKFYEDLDAEGVIGMFATTIAPQTVAAAKEAGVDFYWFHGLQDAFFVDDSVTGFQNWMIRAAAVAAGGNVGASCWTLGRYLRCNPIVFIGLDLGYTPDTKMEDTAYYKTYSMGGATHAQIASAFTHGFNPNTGKRYYQDHVFKNYRDGLFDLIAFGKWEAENLKGEQYYDVETINATEGGSVHHPTLIKSMKLAGVIEKYGGS